MVHPTRLLAAVTLLGFGLVAWQSSHGQPRRPAAGPGTVKIKVNAFHRANTRGAPGTQKSITVTVETPRGGIDEIARIREPRVIDFGDARVVVTHQVRSLIVRVEDAKTKRTLVSTLYQINDRLRNQFEGSHGFSGLSYVYLPNSETEVQVWCEVETPGRRAAPNRPRRDPEAVETIEAESTRDSAGIED